MYYGIVKSCDVPKETKDAAYEAFKIAQEKLYIPENTEIVFFSETENAEKYTEKPELFWDSLDYRLLAKVTGNVLYVNFMQYGNVVRKMVLAGYWIMKTNKAGVIYNNPNALKFDCFYQHLAEDAMSFAEKVLREEGVFS